MRPRGVEILEAVLAEHSLEVALAKDEHVVQAFPANAAEEAFAVRSAPHSRFSLVSRSIRATVSPETRGRCAPRFDFFRQNNLNPARCHLSTVSGLTRRSASLQRGRSRARVAIIALSCEENFGRFALRRAHEELLAQRGILGDQLGARSDHIPKQSTNCRGSSHDGSGLRKAPHDGLKSLGESRKHDGVSAADRRRVQVLHGDVFSSILRRPR